MPGNDTLLLIARPEPAASRLADKARQAGLESVVAPAFDLAGPEDPSRVAGQIRAFAPFDWMVLPSPAAVRHTRDCLKGDWPECRVLVPGPGTARVAREAGLERVLVPGAEFTSEAMLDLPELADVSGARVVICAASGGRRRLGNALVERGAEVLRVQVYRRLPLPPPRGLEARLAGAGRVQVVASSLAILEHLLDAGSGWRCRMPASVGWLVPSPRVADRAWALGQEQVRVVPGMDDSGVINAAVAA